MTANGFDDAYLIHLLGDECGEDVENDDGEPLNGVVPKIAKALKSTFNPIGLNIVNNNDKPLQSVFHFHIHLIPRYENDGMVLSTLNNYGKFNDDHFNSLVDLIKKEL